VQALHPARGMHLLGPADEVAGRTAQAKRGRRTRGSLPGCVSDWPGVPPLRERFRCPAATVSGDEDLQVPRVRPLA
jgi:hypothetical protein